MANKLEGTINNAHSRPNNPWYSIQGQPGQKMEQRAVAGSESGAAEREQQLTLAMAGMTVCAVRSSFSLSSDTEWGGTNAGPW